MGMWKPSTSFKYELNTIKNKSALSNETFSNVLISYIVCELKLDKEDTLARLNWFHLNKNR